MRKSFLMFCLAAYLPQLVFAVAASQAWVKSYVASHAAVGAQTVVTNGTSYTVQRIGDVTLTFENPTVYALKLEDVMGVGFTNNQTFVYTGASLWIDAATQSRFVSTPSNIVFDVRAIDGSLTSSVAATENAQGRFVYEGLFSAFGSKITPSQALAITNGWERIDTP